MTEVARPLGVYVFVVMTAMKPASSPDVVISLSQMVGGVCTALWHRV